MCPVGRPGPFLTFSDESSSAVPTSALKDPRSPNDLGYRPAGNSSPTPFLLRRTSYILSPLDLPSQCTLLFPSGWIGHSDRTWSRTSLTTVVSGMSLGQEQVGGPLVIKSFYHHPSPPTWFKFSGFLLDKIFCERVRGRRRRTPCVHRIRRSIHEMINSSNDQLSNLRLGRCDLSLKIEKGIIDIRETGL